MPKKPFVHLGVCNLMVQNSYKTFVFDCDGVIFDSNQIKTDAFNKVGLEFGSDAAKELVNYHLQHGGVSRYRKFEYFWVEILQRIYDANKIESLVSQYALQVCERLLHCSISLSLLDLRKSTQNASWMVVSGGNQAELEYIFTERKIAPLFNKGVFGSPSTKDEIIKREISSGRLEFPALFIGDSRYDHEVAKRAGMDFIFIYDWTEFSSWREYCEVHRLASYGSLADLNAAISSGRLEKS